MPGKSVWLNWRAAKTACVCDLPRQTWAKFCHPWQKCISLEIGMNGFLRVSVTAISLMVASVASVQALTGPQENAVRSALGYLGLMAFSRAGLIEQLSSTYGDGYSVADATAAVDSLSVDWNEQAVRSARQYLEMMGFSCSGLIEQLSSDFGGKFTKSQATYGAQQAGAC